MSLIDRIQSEWSSRRDRLRSAKSPIFAKIRHLRLQGGQMTTTDVSLRLF